MTRSYVPIGGGVEKDLDIAAALSWLADSNDSAAEFWSRLQAAQRRYREFTSDISNRGLDPSWSDLGPDLVASYLAQAKSLLDDRRSYDFALVSHVAPWLKQLGVNLACIKRVEGAGARALRMLRNAGVLPDTALFELVMASNYAAVGYDVQFIKEGAGKTPDLKLSQRGTDSDIFVELKRLKRGQYEIEEQRQHTKIFRRLESVIHERRLSINVDATYGQELLNVPEDYLALHVEQSLNSLIILPGGYPWRDNFGHGTIRAANVAAVRRDTEDSYLYFGTKMARLLSGRVVSENKYHLAAQVSANPEDPRYVDRMQYGSVITWQSMAPMAIESKASYVRSKLAEADQQIEGQHGHGIVHIAMDAELHSDASDLRRQRNLDNLSTFRMKSQAFAVYLHYLVPRVSEDHSWLTDETVDVFSRLDQPPAPFPAFPSAPSLGNDEPAWHQKIAPSK